MDAMEAEIRKIPNVSHVLIRVNDEDSTVDGIPAHTIAAYVNNGNAGLIAKAGGDLVMPGSKTDFNEIIQALNKGILKRTQLRKNVTRVYRLARKMAG